MNKREELINRLKEGKNEDLKWEFKNSEKFLDKRGNLSGDYLAVIIVSFANREGGNLVVGINDNGVFESNNVFEKFRKQKKDGFDIFKEMLINTIRDKVSPSIEVTINKYVIDDYEIAILEIPRRISTPHAVVDRNSSRIKNRVYYVRNDHRSELIDDEHLIWLFNNTSIKSIKQNSKLSITTDRNFFPTPKTISTVENERILQPQTYDKTFMMYAILLDLNKIKEIDLNSRIYILMESVLYSVFQFLGDGFHNRNSLVSIKRTGDNLMSNNFFKENIYPEDDLGIFKPMSGEKAYWAEISMSSKDDLNVNYDMKKGIFMISISNVYYDIDIEVKYINQHFGLPPMNPFEWIDVKSLKDKSLKQEESFIDYVTHNIEINFNGKMKYPEVFSEEYYKELKYVEELSKTINENWDIFKFYERYPHYVMLYEINKRVRNIELAVDKMENFK